MPRLSSKSSGFTIVELMVVVAIIAALAAAAWLNLGRHRPRAQLATAAQELQALLHGARLQALSSGHDVVVLVFPAFAGPGGETGRVVILEDATFDFFVDGASPNFDDYDPAKPAHGPGGQVVATLDLPPGTMVGPSAGRSMTLPAPWGSVTTSSSCSFCAASGDRRGAIRFDLRGRASFFSANGAPMETASGESLTVTSLPEVPGLRTLVVSASGGAIMAFNDG